MSEKYLWRFYWDCGRAGCVEGLFVATEQEINNAIGNEVYFGEILGKHSEIYGILGQQDLSKVDLDFETIKKATRILGETWSGRNPLDYIYYRCNQCGNKNSPEEFNKEQNKCKYCTGEW